MPGFASTFSEIVGHGNSGGSPSPQVIPLGGTIDPAMFSAAPTTPAASTSAQSSPALSPAAGGGKAAVAGATGAGNIPAAPSNANSSPPTATANISGHGNTQNFTGGLQGIADLINNYLKSQQGGTPK